MGEAIDLLRQYLASELMHHPHVARQAVDEYEEVCADAGRYLAELAVAKQENSLLRSMIDEDSLVGQRALDHLRWLETCEGPEPLTPLGEANARIAALEAENAALRKRAEEAERLVFGERLNVRMAHMTLRDQERAHQSCAADFKALHDRLEATERERDEWKRRAEPESAVPLTDTQRERLSTRGEIPPAGGRGEP
jgi:hypothetical protein